MPFKSESQRRLFYAKMKRGEISKEEVAKWERETPDNKKLPERVGKEAALREKLAAEIKAKRKEKKIGYIKTKIRGL